MKRLIALLAVLLLSVTAFAIADTATATNPLCPVSCSTLLFGDEFNGTSVDTTQWNAKTTGIFTGWTHIAEGGGNLQITATKASGSWQSGWLTGNKTGGYSGPRYIEARARVTCGQGTWNSPVWEWGYPYGAAPSIENDVIEQLGREPDKYHSTLHYWNNGTNPQSGKVITAPLLDSPLCGNFYTYGAAVYADHIDYYLDGTLEATVNASDVGLSDLTTFTEAPNISLNMGGWGGTITIPGPVTMLVDYIHVYRTP